MAGDPKNPPNLDEFDLTPDELRALRSERADGASEAPAASTREHRAPAKTTASTLDLDEFDLPATAAPRFPLREEPTQPSGPAMREQAALDEFDLPLPSSPARLPTKRGHIRIPAGERGLAPDPGADPEPGRGKNRGPARYPGPSGSRRTHAEKGAGPAVFRLFHRLLALNFLIAFASLGRQVDVLVGPRGLLPAQEFMEVLRLRPDVGFAQFPTLFWLDPQLTYLSTGITAGVALSVAALLGILPRLLLVALTSLYLSYAVICRDFLAFQWDSMLIEAGFLAIFLPRDVRSPLMLLGFRLLLFKLYFESGLAKWQSHLGDWQDGSAMILYYQTAPLPTPVAWFAHHLPVAWHHVESFGALAIELIVPFFVLGPRGLRRVAFVALTAFQAMNFATANYGFFIPLSVALHVFLLDDADLRAAGSSVRGLLGLPARMRYAVADWRPPVWRTLGSWGSVALILGWGVLSAARGEDRFMEGPAVVGALPGVEPVADAVAPFRLVNSYHLFGHITRSRVEPEFQTLTSSGWRSHHLTYKPGNPQAEAPWVAPHQPRVDFRLWFYGLAFERGTPEYVQTLLRRLCREPEAVQSLFPAPLPPEPEAVRVRFLDYRYTDPQTRGETGAWWTTREVAASAPIVCTAATGLGAAARTSDSAGERP